MNNPVFLSVNNKPYQHRLKEVMFVFNVALLIFTILGIFLFQGLYVLPLSIFIYLLNFMFYSGIAKTYIIEIRKLGGGRLKIVYMEKDVVKEIITDSKSLSMEKDYLQDKMKWKHIPYLRISDGVFKIKQYGIQEWNEDIMNYILEKLSDKS